MLVRFAVNAGAAGLEGAAAPHAVMQMRPRPPGSTLRNRNDAYATELTELASASGSATSPSPIALKDWLAALQTAMCFVPVLPAASKTPPTTTRPSGVAASAVIHAARRTRVTPPPTRSHPYPLSWLSRTSGLPYQPTPVPAVSVPPASSTSVCGASPSTLDVALALQPDTRGLHRATRASCVPMRR